MAQPWEADPIVEEGPRAGLDTSTRPSRAPRAGAAPWQSDAVITPSSALPNVAPAGQRAERAAGLTRPVTRSGDAAIPTAEEEATGAYTAPPESAAALQNMQRKKQVAQNPIKANVIGAAEAGIETLARLVGGVVGMPLGLVAYDGAPGPNMERGAKIMGDSLVQSLQGPARMLGLNGLGEQASLQGQELTGDVGDLMANAPPVLGVHGTLAGPAAGVAGPGLRSSVALAAESAAGPVQRIVNAVERAMPKKAAGAEAPAGSVGAAGVDAATQRRERAASLPVPVPVTKGDVTRDFAQQRFEKETAKLPETGKPLRERQADKTEAILKNFDDFVDQTGASGDLEARSVGKSVTDPIIEKATKAKEEIQGAYKKARDAGETEELVGTDAIVDKLNEMQASKENAGVIGAAENQLVRLGGAARDGDGRLIPGQISLNDLEEVRKTISANGGKDATNAHFSGQLKAAIDVATDGKGGELYKAARKLHQTYAAEFKNQGVIRDLIGLKKGTTDRKTALADVFDRSVLNATREDLQAVKATLNGAGEKGVQAWNDLRGKTLEWLKERATSNTARDERGNPVISAAKLDGAVKRLDADGRLEELFGKQGAQQLRDVNDLAKDVYTAPPGAVNTSNTASVLMTAFDTMVTFMASGGTVPLPAFTAIKAGMQRLKDRGIRKKVELALKPGDDLRGSPVRAFEPEPPAPAGATPPPTPPTGKPPSGGQATIPGVEPAPVPRGTGREVSKRERELASLREQATDPEVIKDLDTEIAGERRRAADQRRAAEYRTLAERATDPELKAKFAAKAEKLAPTPARPKPEPEPKPEPIPVGEATELEVQDASVDMVKAAAEGEAAWRREHRMGDLDAERAKATWQAMQYDAAAVETAARQHDNSPRAFDREVQRIIEEGQARETQGKQGFDGGEGLGRPAEAAGGPPGAGAQRTGPDGAAAAGAQRSAADAAGRQGEGAVAAPPGAPSVAELFRENKGIKRADMPVIPKRAQPDFVAELNAEGIKTTEETVAADTLKPTQGEYNLDNIEHLRSEIVAGKDNGSRLVVSRDNFVTDGHHRWVVKAQHKLPVDVLRVDLPIDQLLERARDFQKRQGLPARSVSDGIQSSVAKAQTYLKEHPEIPPALRDGIIERYREAERALPDYDKAMRAVGAALGDKLDKVIVAPIKVPSRATEKILVDYKGDPRRIKDLVRGTIVIKDIGAAKTAIAALHKEFGNLLDMRDALSESSAPFSPDGYRDMKMTVMVDGHLCEVQVNVPEMIAAKAEAHPLYEQAAKISRAADDAGRDLTPGEAAQKLALEQRQAQIYGSAWEAATSRLNSGSASDRALRSNEVSGNRRSGSASQARSTYSGDLVTGTPSTSKNSVPAGNDLGSGMVAPPTSILGANPAGRQTIATTERGVEIPVRYRLVDVGQLVTSHDDQLRLNPAFPQELQPRDRSRQSSEAQITKISNAINPEFLAESPKASDGAPIVGSDAVVESGNARTIALRRAYANGKADHYREWLREHAGRFGLSRAEVDGFERPMLVREGVGKYDRAEFARQANESAVSSMSETEQARADAGKLPDLEGLATSDTGEILTSQSQEFVRQFMRHVAGSNEHNQLMTADGRLSQRGAARIRNAVFARAYGDSDIVAMLTEATDGNVRNLLAGMLRAAPDVARVRDLLDAGARAGRDFSPDLVDAVRRFSAAREAGQKVEQYLAQQGMFGGEASPAVAAMMRELEKHSRAPTRIADMIRGMVQEIDSAGDPRQAGMF